MNLTLETFSLGYNGLPEKADILHKPHVITTVIKIILTGGGRFYFIWFLLNCTNEFYCSTVANHKTINER